MRLASIASLPDGFANVTLATFPYLSVLKVTEFCAVFVVSQPLNKRTAAQAAEIIAFIS
ncbi:hypothetical protein TAL182_CH03435 [Rhizobium sp. TAL182]|nr:hypothetical protein TAL182_CH03435 [Rhizobium sp. TAL182]